MNIIERYISAYVVHCLFPTATESKEHLNYVFEVLRETGSIPKNDILRNVLQYIRQGDPADPHVQHEVALYIRSLQGADVYQAKAPARFIAKFRKVAEATMFVILDSGVPVAFAGCKNDAIDKCIRELQETFPGIEIVQE